MSLEAETEADRFLDEEAADRLERALGRAARIWWAPLFDRAAEARIDQDPDDETERRADRRRSYRR